jgi:hypothetical protein
MPSNIKQNTDSDWMSFFKAGYKGTAMYGTFLAVKNFIIALLIFIGIIFLVNYILKNNEDIFGNNFIKGKIKESKCNKYINDLRNSSNINWDCSMNIYYKINNIDYEKKNHYINSNKYYAPNEDIDLRYSKYDNNDITENTWSYNFIGNIVILLFFIILFFSIINLITVVLFPEAAAASGAASLGNTVAQGIGSGLNPGNGWDQGQGQGIRY